MNVVEGVHFINFGDLYIVTNLLKMKVFTAIFQKFF